MHTKQRRRRKKKLKVKLNPTQVNDIKFLLELRKRKKKGETAKKEGKRTK